MRLNTSNLARFIAIFLLCFVSSISFFYYFSEGKHLPYADSMARLNIARKVFDNLTPGFAQLGSVWLPLPQILMLPFIWNDYLWQSGIAGSIMSMTAFIVGGLYLYGIAKEISKSVVSSLLALGIYALNINVLYLQTTALSESLFMCTLSMSMYYLIRWIKRDNWRYLVLAGISISMLTLTRYEGLPVLISSICIVIFCSAVKTRNYRRVERDTLLFTAIAGFGWGLWTLYLLAIFGDPLFWMRYYAAPQVTTTSAGAVAQVYTQAKPFSAAVMQYFTSVTWMSGIIPILYAALGIPVLIYRTIKDRSLVFLPVMMPVSIFLMMVLALQKNTPIVQPLLSLENILSGTTSEQTGFNIRYGLMVFPWVVVLAAYAFSVRKLFLHVFLFLFMGIQLYAYIYPTYSPIYQIPMRIYGKPYTDVVTYMQKNYDKGLILVSASGFEDQMMQMGFPYRYYIHEGTNKYWKEALDHPARYATWIIIDVNHPTDLLGRELKHKQYWSWFYDLVYDSEHAKIYKVKTKPDIDLTGEYKGYIVQQDQIAAQYARAKDGDIIFHDRRLPIVGFNSYDLAYLKPEEILTTIQTAKEAGATTMRVWAFGEGFKEGFQPSPGSFNAETLDNLAYALSLMQSYEMKAVITLANYWEDYGGVPKYLSWDGLPNTTPESWDTFFSHQYTKNRYRQHIEHVLQYESTYSHKKLKDDPTILAWELMNEPRSSTAEKSKIITDWLTEISLHVKGIDPHHMVFAGTEGFSDLYNAGGNGPLFSEVAAIPTIDAVTAHYYPEHNTYDVPLPEIIADWAKTASEAGKPFILEEIGFDKRKAKNNDIDRVDSVRDLFSSLKSVDADGVLLWNWSLKRDTSYGISPNDPKDEELLDVIRDSL